MNIFENTDGRFTMSLGIFEPSMTYQASEIVHTPSGHSIVSKAILVCKVRLSKSDQSLYGLPDCVLAWRISCLRNEEQKTYVQIEAMIHSAGLGMNRAVRADFRPIPSNAQDSIERIAPSVANYVLSAFAKAKSSEDQLALF